MKPTKLLLVITSLFATIVCSAQTEPTEKFPFEPEIKLDTFFKKPSQASLSMQSFKQNVKLESSQKPPKLDRKVPFIAFKQMFENTRDIMNCSELTQCLITVRVSIGLDTKKGRLEVFYQPGYLDNLHIVRGKDSVEGKFIPVFAGKYFRVNKNSVIDTLSESYVNSSFNNYKADIRIRQFGTGIAIWREFQDGLDIRSVTFSFQELYHLYHLNNCYDQATQTVLANCNYNGKIRIVNSTSIQKNAAGDSFYVHSIMFSKTDKVKKFLPPAPNPDDYANLGHLCPPDCDDIIYPID